jgi:hypothetical protein
MATQHPVASSPQRLDESIILRRDPDVHSDVGRQSASQRMIHDPLPLQCSHYTDPLEE